MTRPARRRWLKWIAAGWMVVSLLVLAYGVAWEPRRLVERDQAIALQAWPTSCEGLRIDHVTDIHTGSPANGVDNLDRLVARLVASDAQAVVLTGDYVILSVLGGTYITADEMAPRLVPLTRTKPVFAVLGNHDWWKGGVDVQRALAKAGVIVLEDRAQRVQLGRCPLWFVGIGDLWTAPHDVRKAFADVRPGAPVIALTHNPALFPSIARRASLVLAGHTHGGQISLPGVGQPAMWGKAENRYVRGLYREEGGTLFVSPGVGTSILPLRLGVPPEISRLTIGARAAAP